MSAATAEAMSRVRRLGPARIGVALVVAVAMGVLVVRFPTAMGAFDRRASFNASRSPVERLIAGADGLDIDNTFLAQALSLLPRRASYAIVRSPSVGDAQRLGIVPTTFNALPGYIQFLLLPRRQVEPRDAQWLLCYGCDLGKFDNLDVVWRGDPGLAIARFGG
jgi:hypothetical protein